MASHRFPHLLRLFFAALVGVGFLTSPLPARAEADPSESYFELYQAFQTGEKLENEGNFKAALESYRRTAKLIDNIQLKHPQWQPFVVEYRKKKTLDAIGRVETKISVDATSSEPPPPAQGTPAPVDVTSPYPNVPNLPPQDTATPATPAPTGEDPAAAQISDLENQLKKTRQQLIKAQREQNDLQKQLQKAVGELNQNRIDKSAQEELKAQFEKNQKELAQAKETLAKSNQSVTTLQSQLDQANEALGKALADQTAAKADAQNAAKTKADAKAATDAARQQVADLQHALEDAQADNAVAEEQAALLARKADQFGKAAQQNADALAEAEQSLIAMARERDAERGENQRLTTELTQAREAKAQAEKLLAENGELLKKLDEAQKSVAALHANAPQKEQELNTLKGQLAQVEAQLEAARKENSGAKNTIAELQKQLAETQAATQVSGSEALRMAEENRLLQGIVLRELKEQARREQMRKLVLAELDRLQVRSRELNEKVDRLSQPAAPLTTEERALFKTPQLEIIDNENPSTPIAIAAPGQEPGEGNAELTKALQEADQKLEAKEYAPAREAYQAILAKLPENIAALRGLALAQARDGQPQEAEASFKKWIALAPEDATAYFKLGQLQYGENRFDDAIEALTRSLAIDPKNASAHNFLGVAAGRKGWNQAALQHFQTALQIDPNYGEAHFNLALALTKAEPPDLENARKHYQKALELGLPRDAKLEALLKP